MISTLDECEEVIGQRLDRDGFAIVRNAISANEVEELRRLCAEAGNNLVAGRRGDSVYGIRNLLTHFTSVRSVVSGSPYLDWAVRILGEMARPVYGVFFDKTPLANWPIPWHQDITIRVRERRDVPGFEPRPVKDGVVHMVPPVETSEQILSIRIHLDDASSSHGALRVIPGSHRLGRLSNEQLQNQVAIVQPVSCDVQAGDVMLMRPLLIHASSACERPRHRRVIHIEYAAFDLPGGLRWQG